VGKVTILFDTETTGLCKPSASGLDAQPYITEIFCLKIDDDTMEILGEFDSLIKVPVPLSKEITRITGITDADLANKPSFLKIYPELADFFTGTDNLVAHNLAFDRSMLANDLLRIDKVLNFPWPKNHVCTVEKSLHIEQRRMNLKSLHKHLTGFEFADAHRARNDVMALHTIYKAMREAKML
jgi:DNA polymerase-3 subunit epsilon